MVPTDVKGLESYNKTKEELKKAGETLERNVAVLFYLTEGDVFKFTAWDEYNTKLKFKTKKGFLAIEGITDKRNEKRMLYEIHVRRKSPKRLKKEAAKGLPRKELEITLKDYIGSNWWVWSGTIDEVFGKYSQEIFGDRGYLVNDQVKKLAALQEAILEHFKGVEEKKSGLVEKFGEADSKFAKAVNVVNVYEQNAEQFKGIFDLLPEAKQKEVLTEVIQKGLKNEDVDKWLGEKHPELVDFVGRDSYIDTGGESEDEQD